MWVPLNALRAALVFSRTSEMTTNTALNLGEAHQYRPHDVNLGHTGPPLP